MRDPPHPHVIYHHPAPPPSAPHPPPYPALLPPVAYHPVTHYYIHPFTHYYSPLFQNPFHHPGFQNPHIHPVYVYNQVYPVVYYNQHPLEFHHYIPAHGSFYAVGPAPPVPVSAGAAGFSTSTTRSSSGEWGFYVVESVPAFQQLPAHELLPNERIAEVQPEMNSGEEAPENPAEQEVSRQRVALTRNRRNARRNPVFIPPRLRKKRQCNRRPVTIWRPVRPAVPAPAPADEKTEKTTVMIKNIPSCVRRGFMLDRLDECCRQHGIAYDVMYLPIDFRTDDNRGYAFVNFTSSDSANKFKEAFHGFEWSRVKIAGGYYMTSKKVCEITWAVDQGRDNLVQKFRGLRFQYDSEECLPVLLDPPRNGLNRNPPPPMLLGRISGQRPR